MIIWCGTIIFLILNKATLLEIKLSFSLHILNFLNDILIGLTLRR